MKVKCIKDDDYKDKISIGHEYYVIEEFQDQFILERPNSNDYRAYLGIFPKNHFEII